MYYTSMIDRFMIVDTSNNLCDIYSAAQFYPLAPFAHAVVFGSLILMYITMQF